MILYKIIGSSSILLSAFIFCVQSQKFEREKIKQAESFILLIKFIKKQIDCFCLPLYEIIARADTQILKDCGFRYSKVTNMPPDSSFEWFIENCCFYIDKEATDLIEKFSSELGRSYRDDQLKSCDYYISGLVEYKEKLIAELPRKRKLRCTMCVGASLSFILLML